MTLFNNLSTPHHRSAILESIHGTQTVYVDLFSVTATPHHTDMFSTFCHEPGLNSGPWCGGWEIFHWATGVVMLDPNKTLKQVLQEMKIYKKNKKKYLQE